MASKDSTQIWSDILSRSRPESGEQMMPVGRINQKDLAASLDLAVRKKLEQEREAASESNTTPFLRLTPMPSYNKRIRLFKDTADQPSTLVEYTEPLNTLKLQPMKPISLFGDSSAPPPTELPTISLSINDLIQRFDALNECQQHQEPGEHHDRLLPEGIAERAAIASRKERMLPEHEETLPCDRQNEQQFAMTDEGTQEMDISEGDTLSDDGLLDLSNEKYFQLQRHWVPVYATELQIEHCDDETTSALSTKGHDLKYRFEKIFDILDHPLVAGVDDFGQTLSNMWGGSGKTQFIQKLLERLIAADLALDITILTYDIDMENFLYNQLREGEFPVLRLNTVLDDSWSKEYGVMVRTKKGDKGRINAEADFVIISDARIQRSAAAFSKIKPKKTKVLRFIRLVTMGSLEQRTQRYLEYHNAGSWWFDNAEFYSLVHKENTWSTGPETVAIFDRAIDTLMFWLANESEEDYRFITNQSFPGATILPLIDRFSKDNIIAHSLALANMETPESTRQSSHEIQSPLLNNISHVEENTHATTSLTNSTNSLKTPTSTSKQHVPILHGELQASAMAVIDHTFKYPSLSLSNRQPDPKAGKVRASDSTSDDETSFYSASEFELSESATSNQVRDGTTETEPVREEKDMTPDQKELMASLEDMKAEFTLECKSVMGRVRAMYEKEMSQLKQKYEDRARNFISNK